MGRGSPMRKSEPRVAGVNVGKRAQLLITALVFAIGLLMGSPVANAANSPPLFTTEQQAQQHCPADVVVWLNLPSGVYHFKGQRWYGATKSGAYVCKREADQAGDRATRNGQ
jgi:hypothetical protein